LSTAKPVRLFNDPFRNYLGYVAWNGNTANDELEDCSCSLRKATKNAPYG